MAEKTVSMRSPFHSPGFRFGHEYFIFLLPLFFVLHGYTNHYGDIPGKDALPLALEYLGYVLVFTLVFAIALRSFRKGAVYSFLFFSFYFFFGAAHDVIKEALGDSFLVAYSFILPATFIAFGALFLFVKKTKRSFHRLTRYLNIVLLVLLVVDVVLVTAKPATAQTVSATLQHPAPVPEVQTSSAGSMHYPDIHLIIADEYAGRTALQEVFGFDNTPFEDSLRRRGFYVVDSSHSNYNYTVASMASLFHMNYLPGINDESTEEVYRVSKALIHKNNFTDTLQDRGYLIRNFSVFDFAGLPPFEEPYFPQKIKLITDHTFWGRVKNDIGYHAALTLKIRSELDKVAASFQYKLEAAARKMTAVLNEVSVPHEAPRFFYTHLMMPHDPYLADASGNLVQLDALLYPNQQADEKKRYLGYLQYANNKLLSFIDRLQKTSTRPMVILLMSDHGFRRAQTPLVYHFSNLNAVYFPDRDYKMLYTGFSNVNQLRMLLKKQFTSNLPLLNDSSIYLGSIKESKETF